MAELTQHLSVPKYRESFGFNLILYDEVCIKRFPGQTSPCLSAFKNCLSKTQHDSLNEL